MRHWGAAATVGTLLGCTSTSVFICTDDGQCPDGRCETVGYCSFPDDSCASGWSYGELSAPSVAGTCVGDEVSDGSGTSPPSTMEPATSDTVSTASATTGQSPGDGSSSSMDSMDSMDSAGMDMGSIPNIPDVCVLYGDQVEFCSGAEEGEYAQSECSYYYGYYARYGENCLEAYYEWMVCLSSLDCRQMNSGGANELCDAERMALSAAC